MAKVITTYSFSKQEIKDAKSPFYPQPNSDRKDPRLFAGYPLRKDHGGYFILKSSKTSPTVIREDIPYSVGYALELTRDDALTPDQIIKKD